MDAKQEPAPAPWRIHVSRARRLRQMETRKRAAYDRACKKDLSADKIRSLRQECEALEAGADALERLARILSEGCTDHIDGLTAIDAVKYSADVALQQPPVIVQAEIESFARNVKAILTAGKL